MGHLAVGMKDSLQTEAAEATEECRDTAMGRLRAGAGAEAGPEAGQGPEAGAEAGPGDDSFSISSSRGGPPDYLLALFVQK